MRNQKAGIFVLFFLFILFCSCSHYYYVPSIQNVPLFREKNEYRISGSLGSGNESSSSELQGAYSVTDKIGLFADFMSVSGGIISDNEHWAKGKYFDGAIGYYRPVREHMVFEFYGGIGAGNQHHHYINTTYNGGIITSTSAGTSDLSFSKIFIQPSYGLTFKGLDIAFSTRLSRLSFINDNVNIYGNTTVYNDLIALSDESHYFFEPAITVRGGWKYVKLQLQAGYESYLNNPGSSIGEEYHLSIGLLVAFGNKYKKVIQETK